MAISQNHVVSSGSFVKPRHTAAFVPELWSEEILATYKSNLISEHAAAAGRALANNIDAEIIALATK